nr:TraH DNA transfer protein [uncultured bacterium]
MSEELTEDELLAQALASMDSTPPGEDEEPGPGEPPEPGEVLEFGEAPPEPSFLDELEQPPVDESPFAPLEEPQSLVLQELDESRRPKARTVCERCPNSVWFSSPKEVKCYCRVMFLVSWSTKEPNQITGCDGMFLGQEE